MSRKLITLTLFFLIILVLIAMCCRSTNEPEPPAQEPTQEPTTPVASDDDETTAELPTVALEVRFSDTIYLQNVIPVASGATVPLCTHSFSSTAVTTLDRLEVTIFVSDEPPGGFQPGSDDVVTAREYLVACQLQRYEFGPTIQTIPVSNWTVVEANGRINFLVQNQEIGSKNTLLATTCEFENREPVGPEDGFACDLVAETDVDAWSQNANLDISISRSNGTPGNPTVYFLHQ